MKTIPWTHDQDAYTPNIDANYVQRDRYCTSARFREDTRVVLNALSTEEIVMILAVDRTWRLPRSCRDWRERMQLAWAWHERGAKVIREEWGFRRDVKGEAFNTKGCAA
jgi:hypothetical protein